MINSLVAGDIRQGLEDRDLALFIYADLGLSTGLGPKKSPVNVLFVLLQCSINAFLFYLILSIVNDVQQLGTNACYLWMAIN